MTKFIQINPEDNVAVALSLLKEGDLIETEQGILIMQENVAQGHKFALRRIAPETKIIKYGVPIGQSTAEIRPGEWIHTHNMKTNLSGKIEYTYEPELPMAMKKEAGFFYGFRRKDGKAAIRNEIWIIPTVGCVNDVAKKLAADNQDLVKGTIDGIYAFTHPFGCSQTGSDHAQTRRILADLSVHPNAAAVLVLGLGCENLTMEQFKQELGDFDTERIQFLICQETEEEFAAGRELLKSCIAYASGFAREKIPVNELIIGMKCGGSDGFSGITANPTVGQITDKLISMGGTAVLTEVPEMFGAEKMLLNRCADKRTFNKTVKMLNRFKDYFISHGETVYENPSPGNKAGGITTLEDKSCGCIQKGGAALITDVLDYGEKIRKTGLNLLYGPGNDLVSCTAMTAAGVHIILFTTGRGTPFGAPVPTVKISTNSALATKKSKWIDFDCGIVVEGQSIQDTAIELWKLILEIVNGMPTKNEIMNFREISIFKGGVVL